MRAFELIMPAVFLVWLVATAALAVLGLRRWRWGTPGGGWATAAAGVGLLVPASVLVLVVAEQVAPEATARVMSNDQAVTLATISAWLIALWLSIVAAARSLRPAGATGRKADR